MVDTMMDEKLIEEAINDLKLSLRLWGRKPQKESYETAIRSLEAWKQSRERESLTTETGKREYAEKIDIGIARMEALKKKTDNPAEEGVFFKFPYNDAVDDCIAILRDMRGD